MAAVADLDEMTLDWAVERYIGHWDGYAGALGGKQPNNYFLHSEASGLFRMLPWGTDQTWETRLPFDTRAGIMLNRCFEDESCEAAYTKGLRRVRAEVAGLGLRERAAELASMLRPWQAIDPRREHTSVEGEAAVSRTQVFIDLRAGVLSAWLGDAPPAGPRRASAAGRGPAAASSDGPCSARRRSRYSPRAHSAPRRAPGSGCPAPASSNSTGPHVSATSREPSATYARRLPPRAS